MKNRNISNLSGARVHFFKSAVKIFLKAKKFSKLSGCRRDKKMFKLFTYDRKLDTPANGDRLPLGADDLL